MISTWETANTQQLQLSPCRSVQLGWLCKCLTWSQCSTQKTQQQDLEIWTRCNQHRRCSQTECYRSDSYFSVRDLTSAGGGRGHLTHGQTRGLFRKQRKAPAYWRTFYWVAMLCRPGGLDSIPFAGLLLDIEQEGTRHFNWLICNLVQATTGSLSHKTACLLVVSQKCSCVMFSEESEPLSPNICCTLDQQQLDWISLLFWTAVCRNKLVKLGRSYCYHVITK